MTVKALGAVRVREPWAAGLRVIARATVALFIHGLLRPGTPARLSRSTGRITRHG